MNTPTHLILNAVLIEKWLGQEGPTSRWLPISVGALIPDLPMVVFYLYQRLARGQSEKRIWSELYFEPNWQVFFDVFNSFPLTALAAWIAWKFERTGWLLVFASMALHSLFDFPVHREDAHAHFFPLTNWHFMSPVSYWDPEHFGFTLALAEIGVVLLGGVWLMRRSAAWMWVAAATMGATILFVGFVWITWMPGS